MKKRLMVFLLVLLCCAVPALAILGFGDIVFDPSNFEEAIQQLAMLEQQYVQLLQTYNMIQNQYQQMLWMAKEVPVDMVARYRALATPWTLPSATNTYGTTGGWMTGINTGQNVSGGYSRPRKPCVPTAAPSKTFPPINRTASRRATQRWS